MKRFRRWASSLLAAAVAAVSIGSGLAAPADLPFAEFRFDASDMDQPQREIRVSTYRRDEADQFQPAGSSQYSCTLNRATGDATFFIQANTEGVWVSVDYLTDLDGDGTYELLEDAAAPVGDVMDAQGRLFQLSEGETAPRLTSGEPCLLSPETLLSRSRQAAEDRKTGGSCALDVAQNAVSHQDSTLYMIQLHHDAGGGQKETQTYYLRLYGSVLIPFDVSPADWYYDAVAYGLERGFFAGGDEGLFYPDQQLTRAQLAQVLWSMGGCQQAPASQFFDVAPSSWYYQAVSWCRQNDLIAGYTNNLFVPGDPLSWEQMIAILHRYAQSLESEGEEETDSAAEPDAEGESGVKVTGVSSWAAESVRWAIENGLVAESDARRPSEPVSRALLASVLYTFEQKLGLQPQSNVRRF